MEEVTTKSGVSIRMVIGIAVLVAIAFGGGAYVYVNNKAEKEKENLNAQITELQKQVATLETTATTDETADWKTYINETDKYSLKYPSGWFAEYSATQNDGQTSATKSLYLSASKIVPCTDCAPNPYGMVFHISSSSVASETTLDNVFNQSFGNIDGLEKTQLTIGGQPALKGVVSCEKNEGLGCDNPRWIVINNGKLLIFESGLSYNPANDLIISTFQFIK